MEKVQVEKQLSFNRQSFLLVLLAFGLFGAMFGVWLVLLADLQQALALSPAALGGALAAGLTAALPVMLVGGRLIDRWGVSPLLTGAAVFIGLALVGVAMVGSYWLFVLLLLLFFGATGAFDVGINAAAIQVEQASGRKILSYFHATFSGCAALFALLTGMLVSLELPFRMLYLGVAVLAFAYEALIWRSRTALPQPAAPAPSDGLSSQRGKSLYLAPAVLLLAFITASGFMVEGEIGNWASIYLRSSLDLPAVLGAAGVAVFHAAMLTGRLGAAWMVRRFQRRSLLQLAGVIASAGMLLALATETAPIILAGFLVTGMAIAVVAPVTFSLVGDVAPTRVGEASSVLTTVAYLGLLLGPILIGVLAEFIGLRLALGSIILVGIFISLLSYWVLHTKVETTPVAAVTPELS